MPDDQLVSWPASLVDQIANGRWVLFIGAGVAASCSNDQGNSPPGWVGLLTQLAHGISDDVNREGALRLIDQSDLIRAAEHIRWAYAEEAKTADYYDLIRRLVQGPAGHLFVPSDLHVSLLDLEPGIVVTTNYDRLFEQAAGDGFDPLPYTSAFVGSNVRRGKPLILKLHGSITEMQNIVLTRSDYLELKQKGAHALEVVRALFQTHSTLFIGYSISDPDVQLLLEVGTGYADPEAHYLLTRSQVPSWELATFRKFFGVSCLVYDETRSDLRSVIDELSDLVHEARGVLP